MRAHPRDRTARKTLRFAHANLQEVIAAGVHVCFGEYLADTERLTSE